MNGEKMSRWLRFVLLGMGLWGLVIYFAAFPMYGQAMVGLYPEFAGRYWPWLIFLWASGIPCAGVLVLAWKIVGQIRRGRAFCLENARHFAWIGRLAAGDAVFFFVGNVAYLCLNLSHPSVVLASLGVVFLGIAVAVCARAMEILCRQAAQLQEESDFTI